MPLIEQLLRELKLEKSELLEICTKFNISVKKTSFTNAEASRIREAAKKLRAISSFPSQVTTVATNQSNPQDTASSPSPSQVTTVATANQNKHQDEELVRELIKMEERAKIAEERVKTLESVVTAREDELVKREKDVASKEAIALNGFNELEAATHQEWVIQKEQKINAQRGQIVKDQERLAKTILDAAQKEADKIVEQAESLANEHRHRAREQTIQVIQAREAQLETRTRQLDAKEQSFDARESNVRTRDSQLRYQEQELEEENTWLASEKKKLRHKEEDLLARERACSEEAIAKLTAEKFIVEQQLSVIQAENYRLREELEKTKSILQAASGSPESLLEQNTRLENRLREYEQKFDEYPTDAELAELRRRAEAANQFEAMYQDLQASVDDLERIRHQHQIQRMQTEHLRKERDTLKLLNQYLNEQKEELELLLGELKDKKSQAFSNFADTDARDVAIADYGTKGDGSNLNALARRTRAWMASLPTREDVERGESNSSFFAHYYDEHTIQAFMASMAASKLIIIQGVSGTGKTSLPEYFAHSIGGKSTRIEVQSSWRDKLDLMGSYNSFFRTFNESPFSRAIYEAGTNRYRYHPYFIILDEMNLSRVEYYFADLLSIMEGRPEERAIELLNHDPTGGNLPKGLKQQNGAVKLPIPDNVWFVGTANTDESTYEITRKVYDRAQVLQIDETCKNGKLGTAEKANLDIREFLAARGSAIASLGNADRQAVQSCIEDIGMALKEYFQVGYGQRFLDQLFIFVPTYVAAGGSLGKGLDHFISRKLLWQVQNRTDPNVRKGLQEVRDTIEQSFADNSRLGKSSISLHLLDRELNRFKR